MPGTEDPTTFRIAISFVRRPTFSDTNPKTPSNTMISASARCDRRRFL